MGKVDLRRAVADDVEFLWIALDYASHSFDQRGVTIGDIKRDPKLNRYVGDTRSVMMVLELS